MSRSDFYLYTHTCTCSLTAGLFKSESLNGGTLIPAPVTIMTNLTGNHPKNRSDNPCWRSVCSKYSHLITNMPLHNDAEEQFSLRNTCPQQT